jgi:2-dehydropantoate 2-reductase
MDAIAPAMGPESAVLPLLNGITHIDALTQRFGGERVIGGACFIGAALEPSGEVRHGGEMQAITFGELSGARSARCQRVADAFATTKVKWTLADDIVHAMWEKFVMLASLAATTTITRAVIGEILDAPRGEAFMLQALAECQAVAKAEGHPASDAWLERTRKMLTARGSQFTASMMRDLVAGGPTEGDHIIGDLVRRAKARGIAVPLLAIALTNLQVHEARRAKG